MTTIYRSRGPWLSRFAIRFLAVIWGLLIFWSLGLLVDDIGSFPGPEYPRIEQRYLNTQLVTEKQTLDRRVEEIDRKISNLQEEQRILGESSDNLQQTIDQLIKLQRSSQGDVPQPSSPDQASLATSLKRFLENQTNYQALNQEIAQIKEEKRKLTDRQRQIDQQLEQQRKPAKAEYNRLNEQHRLKLAALKLLILIPLLLLASWLLAKRRGSIYFTLILSFSAATLLKSLLIIDEYFPDRWVQYILTIVLLLVIARLLIYLIRSVVFPKQSSLLQQYREAYESFLCPVCEYPIRVGPRRYLFWTRRTVNKIVLPSEGQWQEEFYTCPACGTGLFKTCEACHQVRHALLPYCHHCGTSTEALAGDIGEIDQPRLS
jgi:predicted RNA-binding Zn-ribbon protein involved in translation (DUF1610 family)